MKTCSRCKTPKSEIEFIKRSASKDGLTAACRCCLNKEKRLDYIISPEQTIERVKRNEKRKKAEDPIWRNAWNACRAAKERNRVPPWVNFTNDILPVYRKLLSGKQVGINGFVVDHVVPLKGKSVSGLHVPGNLQLLSFSDNCKKGHSY